MGVTLSGQLWEGATEVDPTPSSEQEQQRSVIPLPGEELELGWVRPQTAEGTPACHTDTATQNIKRSQG